MAREALALILDGRDLVASIILMEMAPQRSRARTPIDGLDAALDSERPLEWALLLSADSSREAGRRTQSRLRRGIVE